MPSKSSWSKLLACLNCANCCVSATPYKLPPPTAFWTCHLPFP
eukprot:CAMPEP_0202363236 /NCGR_PEP_ID=MMETSP1126-20121109/15118_1 /ASSEMBLY_ACC=CAM_ASM_000457 /TAXON_ID=3047 /ORGANISM="Dunaliella tertiolecta, Strain CCMP1320" /LENGTH=42 /DNA_ID= /DNA_START= /DNA_END= /DNA_ORIENTATION=